MSGIYINHNSVATSTANNLSKAYSDLATSTRRLSSGLRINSAADDAAGLAIRELQRSDIAALHQGVRNANDAISMLQTFDGALGVIDEKLIRMKELAEQASTGTYDSTQRLMIDSEFQAMGSEINRIAIATDFNGIKLLVANMETRYRDVDKFFVTDSGSSTYNNQPPGTLSLNFSDAIAKKYINENNETARLEVRLSGIDQDYTTPNDKNQMIVASTSPDGLTTEYKLGDSQYTVAYVNQTGNASNPVIKYDSETGWSCIDDNAPNGYNQSVQAQGETFIALNLQMVGNVPNVSTVALTIFDNDNKANVNLENIADTDIKSLTIDTKNGTYSITKSHVGIDTDPPATGKNAPSYDEKTKITKVSGANYTAEYNVKDNTISIKFVNGGTATLQLDAPLNAGEAVEFDINLAGEVKTVQEPYQVLADDQKVKIHFGPGNDAAEDYYYINYQNCTLEGLGLDGVRIETQQAAQEALVTINDAIVAKDKSRSYLGTMQNRLENTVANLTTQAENLQASESRISDADIAQEMMTFVRNQVLTQSAIAMLAQANSLPQMVMRLVQ